MSKKMIVRADGDIPYGARVLVRGSRASLAGENLANATAAERPKWLSEQGVIEAGQHFSAFMDGEIGQRDLHAIANGPIMDEGKIYLPAGRISMEAFRERQRAIVLDENP